MIPLDRLPAIASVLTGRFADQLARNDLDYLRLHHDRNDWNATDVVRVREMLPADLRWLLQPPANDDEAVF